MVSERLYDDAGSRVLTREAFGFVLHNELRRAIRSQEFLTLIRLDIEREWEELVVAADEWIIKELAEIISCHVRELDVLAHTAEGVFLLLAADFELAVRVIERVIGHIHDYRLSLPLRITFGAACYPTHAVDAEELLREVCSRQLVCDRVAPS